MKYGLKKVHVVILCIVGLYVLALCASPCVCMAWFLSEYNACYMGINGEEDEIWIADDIDFYMMWDVDAEAVLGAAIVDGERIDLDIGWSSGFMANKVRLFPYPYPEDAFVYDILLMEGLIKKNGRDKYIFSMEGYEKYNKLFPEYDTISITKYAESEIEWVDGWPVPIEG